VNVVGAGTVARLAEVVDQLSGDELVQVVVFTSSTPGYFFNHADLAQVGDLLAMVAAGSTPTWVELVTRLTNAPFIGIASIRGRTRGGGDELTLAFDLRYASLEQAIFSQPEVGTGLVPGGGGSDRLPRLIGRDRALEAILTSDDYDAARAEHYGWVTRAVPDAELDDLVHSVATRIASFDKAAVLGAKAQINRATLPPQADLRASWAEFAQSVTRPGFQARVPQFGTLINQIGLTKSSSTWAGTWAWPVSSSSHAHNRLPFTTSHDLARP